ncbi:hypothetical protein Tsubulata_022888 [Turnera subulata]|uniref:RRM domain-containing protein n=1 Tax=Turnera subulata TaxID=218843 RepID=A0A9Q0JAH1_9ROSI|nr:hypothetical protein Tsubulata_022888 [Turnera subulata]
MSPNLPNTRPAHNQPSASPLCSPYPTLLPPSLTPPLPKTSVNPTNTSPPHPTAHPSPQAPKPLHFSKWSRSRIQNFINNQKVVNLYVDNLPLQWSAVELHLIFSKFGEVIDVYIPAKKAKNGKRFCFARFSGCQDTPRLISSINHIRVGNGFLHALIARSRTHQQKTTVHKPIQVPPPPPPHTLAQNSFSNTVKTSIPPIHTIANPISNKASIYFTPHPNETEWLSRCAFGFLSEPLNPPILSQLFQFHGHQISVSEFGGGSILIHFLSPETMTLFFESNPHWTSNIFALLRPWRKDDRPSNRKCWIRAWGVPLHARSLVHIDGSNYQVTVDELPDFLPNSVTPPHDFPYPPFLSTTKHNPLPTNPSPQQSQSNLPSTKPVTVAYPPRSHHSDPFNLWPIIENTKLSNISLACPDNLLSQSSSAKPSTEEALACSHPLSSKLDDTSKAARVCHSPCNSSTGSSPANSPMSSPVSACSSYGLSSVLGPVISFNNSDLAPIRSILPRPAFKRAQSLPNLYLSLSSSFPKPMKLLPSQPSSSHSLPSSPSTCLTPLNSSLGAQITTSSFKTCSIHTSSETLTPHTTHPAHSSLSLSLTSSYHHTHKPQPTLPSQSPPTALKPNAPYNLGMPLDETAQIMPKVATPLPLHWSKRKARTGAGLAMTRKSFSPTVVLPLSFSCLVSSQGTLGVLILPTSTIKLKR